MGLEIARASSCFTETLLTLAGVFIVSAVSFWVGATIAGWPLRKAADAFWVERARLAWPLWRFLRSAPVVIPLMFFVFPMDFDRSITPWFFGIFISAFFGALGLSAPFEHQILKTPTTLSSVIKSWIVLGLLFLPTIAVCGVLALVLPDSFNEWAVAMILAALVAQLLLLGGGSFKILRLLKIMRNPTPRLVSIMEAAARRMGTRPRPCFILRWRMANALAFPLNQKLCVTEPLVNALTDEELAAICSHELAHLDEPKSVIFTRMVGAMLLFPLALWNPLTGTFGSAGILYAASVTLLGSLVIRRLSRRMEVRADAAGCGHEADAGSYARALETIYQLNVYPAVMNTKRASHPHLYDRMLAANVTPAYPRPKPPSTWRYLSSLAVTCSCAALLQWILHGLMGRWWP